MESMLGRRRRSKKEISVLHWFFRNNCVSPSSSRTFRTQSYWSFITGQCDYSEQLLPVHVWCPMCNQFTLLHQFGIDIWRSKFEQQTDSILPALWILWTRITRILIRSTWVYRVMHNTFIKHGRDIRTQYIWSTSILLWRKDWSSIRLDRTQSFFMTHFQLIVFRKLLGWKMEKSFTKKFSCHLDFLQRSLETWLDKRIGFRTCSTTRRTSWATF